jgi:hypothetical protein
VDPVNTPVHHWPSSIRFPEGGSLRKVRTYLLILSIEGGDGPFIDAVDPGTDEREEMIFDLRVVGTEDFREGLLLVLLNIDEKEARDPDGDIRPELLKKIPFDQHHGEDHHPPDPQGQEDQDGLVPGAEDIGLSEPEGKPSRLGKDPEERPDAEGGQGEEKESGGDRPHEDPPELP